MSPVPPLSHFCVHLIRVITRPRPTITKVIALKNLGFRFLLSPNHSPQHRRFWDMDKRRTTPTNMNLDLTLYMEVCACSGNGLFHAENILKTRVQQMPRDEIPDGQRFPFAIHEKSQLHTLGEPWLFLEERKVVCCTPQDTRY